MRKSGPMPEYTIPILGHMTATFSSIESSIKIDDDFFSVAITIPLDANGKDVQVDSTGERIRENIPLIPRLVVPCDTAASACSICTSFPLGEKTVKE
jgi:hypothetical protein